MASKFGLKATAMTDNMRERDEGNRAEAQSIPGLFAPSEAGPLVRQTPSGPSPRAMRAAQRASRDASYDGQAPTTLEEIAAGVQLCRRCDLYRDATQGVAGEGAARARLMFVGEQPGDQEDLAGRPFVGPRARCSTAPWPRPACRATRPTSPTR